MNITKLYVTFHSNMEMLEEIGKEEECCCCCCCQLLFRLFLLYYYYYYYQFLAAPVIGLMASVPTIY